jgi:hypothetical protein
MGIDWLEGVGEGVGANKQAIGGWKKKSWLSSEGEKKQGKFVASAPSLNNIGIIHWWRALWSLLWLTCVHVHSRSRAMALKALLGSDSGTSFQ